MDKYDIIGGVIGIILVGGIATAIHRKQSKELDIKVAEAKAKTDETIKEIEDTIKSVNEMNRDLDEMIELSKQRLEEHKIRNGLA